MDWEKSFLGDWKSGDYRITVSGVLFKDYVVSHLTDEYFNGSSNVLYGAKEMCEKHKEIGENPEKYKVIFSGDEIENVCWEETKIDIFWEIGQFPPLQIGRAHV